MRRRGRWAGPLLLGLSLAVALAASEGVVRWLRPQYLLGPDPIRNPFWQHDDRWGWRHAPGAAGTFEREEFSHQVRINSAGWRDEERARPKPTDRFRLAVLGDSFTWGHGVADEEVYTRRVQSALASVEVLNFGLSASATDQQLLILKDEVLAYQPDAVLVMVSRNDFVGVLEPREGSYPKPRFELDESGRLRLTGVPVPQVSTVSRLHHRLRRRSALLNLLESVWEESGEGSPALPGRTRRARRLIDALLLEMNDECRRAGAAFAIGLAPSHPHVYVDPVPAGEQARFEGLRDLAARAGIPLLDLVPAFRRAARDEQGRRVELFYRKDHHWNSAGHQVAASEIAHWLGSRK